MSSGGAKSRRASELMKAFESAKSSKEMVKIFHKMEKVIDDDKLLGMQCWQLAEQFNKEAKEPEKLLSYGKRALQALIDTENQYTKEFSSDIRPWTSFMASLLSWLGCACCELRRYDEGLSYLNWSMRNLRKLELDRPDSDELVLPALLATHIQMFRIKVGLERREEVVVHLTEILEIKEKLLGKDCLEVGKCYKDVFSGYIVVEKYKEALPYCLKAVEIYVKHFGERSVEVARVRSSLALIYRGLKDCENALEQTQLAQSVLKRETSCEDFLITAEMLMHLGRYEEAVPVLKGVVSKGGDSESELARAFLMTAKSFCGMGRFDDARNEMKLAMRIFDKKGVEADIVVNGLLRMAELYEEMKDFETAISMLLRLLTMAKIPEEILSEYSARHAELIMRKEKAVEGQGPSEEDTLDEAFALLQLVKEDVRCLAENSSPTASPEHSYDEEFSAKASSSH